MPSHLKFCGCKSCRAGLHRGAWGSFIARRSVRRLRHLTKLALKWGQEPPRAVSVPYTD